LGGLFATCLVLTCLVLTCLVLNAPDGYPVSQALGPLGALRAPLMGPAAACETGHPSDAATIVARRGPTQVTLIIKRRRRSESLDERNEVAVFCQDAKSMALQYLPAQVPAARAAGVGPAALYRYLAQCIDDARRPA
jgi:hypothetical protein